jgi:hypothetical protein
MKKPTILLFCVTLVFLNSFSQINIERLGKNAAEAYINDGDIILSHTSEFNEKKKNENKISEIDPTKPLFLTIALNRKISSHDAFNTDKGLPYAWLRITSKNGDRASFQMTFKAEDANKKFATIQLSDDPLSSTNPIHNELAKFFGKLPNEKHNLLFHLENDDKIKANIDINCSNGTGIYGVLLKEIENEKKRKDEEERLKKEEEARVKKEAMTKYFASSDIVKITLNNIGQYQGNIKIETGNTNTNQFVNVSKGKKSEPISCRPGDKVYVGNDLVHTVASASNNKTIEISPKRPVTSPDCYQGSKRISTVKLENQTGRYLRYEIMGDGFSGRGSILAGGTDSITCCPYGYELKINIIDDQNTPEKLSNYSTYITITQDHEGKTITIK